MTLALCRVRQRVGSYKDDSDGASEAGIPGISRLRRAERRRRPPRRVRSRPAGGLGEVVDVALDDVDLPALVAGAGDPHLVLGLNTACQVLASTTSLTPSGYTQFQP